jgi:5-methylcytosine-specific restriction enzyme B
MSALRKLASLIIQGRSAPDGAIRPAVEALFGERYPKNALKDAQIRYAYALGREDSEGGVPWAGLINPDNPTSGPYGGTSLVWFPGETTSLIGLGVGTRGIAPDEGILTRPGHRRRVAALRRLLAKKGVVIWSKADPAALNVGVPKSFSSKLPEFGAAFRRYANEMYCVAQLPSNPALAEEVVRFFLDLYAYERGWLPLVACQSETEAFLAELRGQLFQVPTVEGVSALVRARRFVVLQGAPGTGKTRLAERVKRDAFVNRGATIQFHPSVTYEDFVLGLSPDPMEGNLRFRVRQGALLDAAEEASARGDFLLVIDEINRADLGKVLGEAIYLFEPREVGGTDAREIRLPHAIDGNSQFRLPETLYVLGTMNTADRSIASLDLAIRRRFAFVSVPPDRSAIENNAPQEALEAFDALADVFVEHAPDDALDLLPGQAYFLASDVDTFRSRVKHELVPLLDDYLRQGLLGPASAELQALRDRFEDQVS